MTRRFTARTAGVFAALLLASCIGDGTGPSEKRPGLINIAPDFNIRGIHSVDVNRVLIRFTKPNSTILVYDTIVPFPAADDTLDLRIHVPISGASEQLLMTILMIDDPAADTVFQSGPTLITATAGSTPPPPTPVTFTYVGVGAKAAGVRFVTTPTLVLFGDTVLFTAEAFDSNNVTIPNTPIVWSSSDTTRARLPSDSVGRVIGGIARGPVTITAALLTPPSATRPLLIQPKPNAVVIQGGSGQTGGVGSPLAQPVAVRVNAADNLGVQGVIVNFAIATGGGTLSQLVDTTDVNGDASAIWTLGATLGAQSVSVTVPTVTGGSVTVPATGVVGTAKKLVFLVQPSNVSVGQPIAPAVTVTAQDTFGNTVATFTGGVTIAIGANPGGASLSGTLTLAAVAGVATFNSLALSALGSGYTLTASATGLAVGTSNIFNVAGGVPTQLAIVQQPSNTSGGAAITPAVTVQIRDALNNLVPTATTTITVAIANNPSAGVLGGTLSVAAVSGVATFSNLSIDKSGIGYTLAFTATGLTTATSAGFDISAGPATTLGFTTQPPASAIFQSPFVTVVTARDAGGNVATSYSGAVTLGIGVNPASGSLFGTTTVSAVAGVATFSGVSLDNIGNAYTLTANATGLAGAGSGGLNVVAPANANAWINPSGGNWSTAANWSLGTVPNATDTVFIRQSGSYTVNLDVSTTLARLDVGGLLGAQTLNVQANTLTMAGNGAFNGLGQLILGSTGSITGAGVLDIFGGMDWQGGSLNGGAGKVAIAAGGTLSISGIAARNLSNYTLELGGVGTWSGSHTINSGSIGILRVLPGGVLDVTGDPTFSYNLGGSAPALDNQGTVNRTTSFGTAVINVPISGAGTWNAVSGNLDLQGGGSGTGALVAAGQIVFNSGTFTFGAGSSFSGGGTVRFNVGTVTIGGSYAVAGTTVVGGGTANFNATGSTANLTVQGGTIGGSGLLTVSGAMTWSGGNMQGAGGTTRVATSGTLAISGAATRNLTNYTLELAGTGTWTGTQSLQSGSLGVLRVLSGATLDIQGDPNFVYNLGGTASRFEVQGTLTRTVSAGIASVSAEFDNDAQTTVSSGTLRLSNGSGAGTADGTYTANVGATLDFNAGTHALGAAGAVAGAGTALVSGGTVNAGGAWTVSGTTQVTAGTLAANGAAMTTAALSLTGGTIGGSAGGLLTVTGPLTWSGGNMQGAGGTTRVATSGTLAISGAATRNLTNYTLELAGTGTWTGTQSLQSGSLGVLRVVSGANLDIQGDPNFVYNLGGTASRFEVQGSLTRTVSAGIASVSAEFDNDAQTTVSTGTLRLSGGSGAGTADGAYTVSAGATLDFNAGTHTLGAASSLGGVGTALVSGGTVNASGNWVHGGTTQVTAGVLNYSAAGGSTTDLAVSGGTLGGTAGGVLGVSGAMTWTGGNLQGSGGAVRVQVGGTLAISGTATRNFTNYVLELAGNGTWTGTHVVQTGSLGILRILGGATLDVQGDPSLTYNLGGTQSRVEVLGTLQRSVSAGAVSITAAVDDSGLVRVTSGTLQLDGGGTSNGSYVATASGTLSFGGGTHNLSAASAFNGAGTAFVQIPGGTVNASGAWVNSGTTRVNGGVFNFNGAAGSTAALDVSGGTLGGAVGGVLDVTSAMTWSAGNLSGTGGTTRVSGTGSLAVSGTATRNLTNYVLELGTTGGTWTGTHTIQSGSGAVFRVLSGGLLDIRGDATFTYNLGGAASLFDNQGTVVRTVSTGTATMNVPFTTTNLVNVSTGTLALTNGGTLGGSVVANTPGVLSLASGTFAMANNLALSGTGGMQLNGATMNGLAAGDTVRSSVTSLLLNTGTLSPAAGATIKVTGNLNWANSATLSGGGKTLIATGGTVVFSGTATRNLSNHVIEIASSTGNNWTGALTMQTGSGAVLRVLPTGAFNLQAAASFLYVLGGAVSSFENQGTLTVAPGAASTFTTSAPFNNSATLNVTSGTLALTNGGTQSGPVSLTSSTFLDFTGGTHTLNNGTNVTGVGQVRLNGATITTGTALDTARFVTLLLNSGTLSQPGGVVVSGLLDWAGSAGIIGTGMTRLATGSLTLTGTATRNLQNGVLENRATASWSGAFTMQTGSSAVFRNAAGGTLNWTADAAMAYVLGGALTTFVNEGSLTVNTGSPALAARFSGNFIDTTGSLLTVTSGDLMLQNGGRIGGAPSIGAGAFLEVVGGTLSLKGGLTSSGTGNLRINGGTVTVDSGLTATVPNVELIAGTITHEGLLLIPGVFNWTAGNITSNAAGFGGTTRVPLGGTANLLGTVARSFTGTHALEIGGTGVWSGTFFINTGSGATLRVLSGGTLDVQATNPTISYNLGGAAPVLNNLGAITRSTGAAGWVVNVPVSGTGTWNITAGNLDMQGGGTVAGATTVGAGTTLLFNAGTHTYTAPVTGTGTVNVNGGTVSYNTTMNIPTLTISGGSLVMGGQPVSVTGNFTTSGSGTLSMTNAADSLDINGNASFGGGTGTLSNGVIRVAGNFTQVGATAAYAPSPATGAHRVVLDGAAAQTVSFGSTVFSSFRRLEVNKAAGGVVLGSNVKASFFRMVSGTTLNGAFRLITDTVYSPNFAHTIAPLVVEISAVLGDSGGSGFLPDTTVFTGANQSISPNNTTFLNYAYKSIRVAQTGGTATFPANLTVPNDLVVSSGPLDIGAGRTINVTGAFRTEGTGQLQMVSGTGALVIAGNATFGGSSTAGVLTAGTLTVNGDFTQAGGSINAFTPTGTQHTTLSGTGAQNISFANPTTSRFDVLDITCPGGGRNVVLLTNIGVVDSLIQTGGGANCDVIGAGTTQRLTTTGVVRLVNQTSGPRLAPPVLEVSGAMAFDSIFQAGRGLNADTTVYLAGATLFTGTPVRYKSVRAATGGVLTYGSGGGATQNWTDLEISSGTLALAGTDQIVLSGNLRTTGTGVLRMQSASSFLQVNGNASFGGGSSVGALTNGTLRVNGSFTQTSGSSGASFQATAGHTTVFGGSTPQTVTFSTPGAIATTSTFGNLFIGRSVTGSSSPTGIALASNIFVAGTIQDTSTNVAANDSILGAGFTVTAAGGMSTGSQFVMNNALLVLNNYATFNTSGLTFRNMNPAVNYLTLNRNTTGTNSISGLTFSTVPTTGRYLVVNNTSGLAYTLTVNPASPVLASMTGFYSRTGAPLPTINWNGQGALP
jgi:hypothetical protein